MELKLNGLEAPDEMQIKTVTQQATKPNPEKPKPICHHCKKPGHLPKQVPSTQTLERPGTKQHE